MEKELGENVELRWMGAGADQARLTGFSIVEGTQGREVTYSDGSRGEGHTAAATIGEHFYLGRYATVADAELLGMAMAWKLSTTVGLDSTAAIDIANKLLKIVDRGNDL